MFSILLDKSRVLQLPVLCTCIQVFFIFHCADGFLPLCYHYIWTPQHTPQYIHTNLLCWTLCFQLNEQNDIQKKKDTVKIVNIGEVKGIGFQVFCDYWVCLIKTIQDQMTTLKNVFSAQVTYLFQVDSMKRVKKPHQSTSMLASESCGPHCYLQQLMKP